jgi:hypothetical protein
MIGLSLPILAAGCQFEVLNRQFFSLQLRLIVVLNITRWRCYKIKKILLQGIFQGNRAADTPFTPPYIFPESPFQRAVRIVGRQRSPFPISLNQL